MFMPALLKPAPAAILALATILEEGHEAAKDIHRLPAPGLTSVPRENLPTRQYRAAGFYPTRARAIRLDMLERLDDLIRPLLGKAEDTAKTGKTFQMNADMMSIMGCGAQDLVEILSALGYRYTKPEKNEVTCEPAPAEQETTSEAPAPTEAQNKEGEASNGGAETANGQTDIDDPLTWAWQLAPRTKRGNRTRKKPNGKKPAAKHEAKTAMAKTKEPSKKRRQKPPRDTDPNSPFAALRNLNLSEPENPTQPQEPSK